MTGERAFERGQLQEARKQSVPVRAALELDHHPQPLAVRLVPQVGDALQRPVLGLGGDALQNGRLAYLVRDLRDHDPVLFHKRAGPDRELPFAGLVGSADPLPADDDPSRRQVRAGDEG